MANNKSTPVIVIGVAVFIVGAGLAFLLLHNNNSKSKSKTTSGVTGVTRTTLQASSVAAGTTTVAQSGSNFQIPAGKNAVAVQVSTVPGLDGFAKAGDLINIFANVTHAKIPGALTPPETKLIATNVAVLEVLSAAPSSVPSGGAVYLLALDPTAAEQIIFFATYESLYFSLVPSNSAPATTPGRSYQNAA